MDNVKDKILSIIKEGTGSQNIRYDSTDKNGVLWFFRSAHAPKDQFDDLVNTVINVSNNVKAELEVKKRSDSSSTETLPVTDGSGQDDHEDTDLTNKIKAIPEIITRPNDRLCVPDSFDCGLPYIFTALINDTQVHFALIDEVFSPSITFRCNNPKKLMTLLKGIANELNSRLMTKGVSDFRSGYIDKPISFFTNKKDSLSIETSFKGEDTEGHFRIRSTYYKDRGFTIYISTSYEWISAPTEMAIKQIIEMLKTKA